ncbi:MAG: NADH-quinone oxidoreductase subunit J [Verrucomicrobia bacterium]|nr:NADH-quinone oxidoreductase subunit J [Verrucomicrobiota bacterium]
MTSFPASAIVAEAIFGGFVALTVAGALLAALATRILRSVCGLAVCSLGLAGLYTFLHSPFLGLMQILIYIGAVCVTIVFAIMLAETEESAGRESRRRRLAWGGTALAVSGCVFWGVARLGWDGVRAAPASRATDGSVGAIGVSLLTTHGLAFELISLVLLVAILGALLVARTGRH